MGSLMALGLWLAALVVAFVPAVLVGAWSIMARRRDARRSPLVGELRQLPGESLAIRAEALSEKINDRSALAVAIGPVVLAFWAIWHLDPRAAHIGAFEGALIIGVILVSFLSARSAARLGRACRRCLEGQAAERATAQALTPLIAKGCALYNDIPAQGFNLDHVVVGADRVYVIETKSRRKPAERSAENAQVRFDGHVVQFPGWSETKPLDQARAEARWLAQHLYRKTGERVPVDPVLALPGWYVTQSVPHVGVHVINPAMHRFMADCKGVPMSGSQRRRVMTVIEDCYAGA